MILDNLDAELDRIRSRLFDFIDRYADAAAQGLERPVFEHSTYSPPPKPRAPRRRFAATLSELLDNIAETFATLTKPLGYCGIEHDTRIGLRKLGPSVFPNGNEYLDVITRISDPEALPAMMFTALRFQGYDERTEDKAPASFFYAIKLHRAPSHVEPIRGTVFEFGYCADFRKRSQWDSGYVVVLHDGSVHACRQQFMFPRHTKQGTYYQKRSDVPMHEMSGVHTANARKRVIEREFLGMVTAWRAKAGMWSTSVRHNGYRATFMVPPRETKHYFKDRDRKALAPSGRLRPIFHFVRDFDREVRPGKVVHVREHTRGLRLFDWNGYACAIIAPQFHTWVADKFTLSATNEEYSTPGEQHIFGSKMGSMLARMEDEQRPVKPESRL